MLLPAPAAAGPTAGSRGGGLCEPRALKRDFVRRGLYGAQLEWWLQHFPAEQLLVVSYREVGSWSGCWAAGHPDHISGSRSEPPGALAALLMPAAAPPPLAPLPLQLVEDHEAVLERIVTHLGQDPRLTRKQTVRGKKGAEPFRGLLFLAEHRRLRAPPPRLTWLLPCSCSKPTGQRASPSLRTGTRLPPLQTPSATSSASTASPTSSSSAWCPPWAARPGGTLSATPSCRATRSTPAAARATGRVLRSVLRDAFCAMQAF